MESVPLSMWTNLLGLTAPASQTRVPCLQELFLPCFRIHFSLSPPLVWYLFFFSLPKFIGGFMRYCAYYADSMLACWNVGVVEIKVFLQIAQFFRLTDIAFSLRLKFTRKGEKRRGVMVFAHPAWKRGGAYFRLNGVVFNSQVEQWAWRW